MTDIAFVIFFDAYAKTVLRELRDLAAMVDLCIEDMEIRDHDVRAFLMGRCRDDDWDKVVQYCDGADAVSIDFEKMRRKLDAEVMR